jgi:hypothetical protein
MAVTEFEKRRTLGATAGLSAALAVSIDAKGEKRGGELFKHLCEAIGKDAMDSGFLTGFCEELERYITGWITGINPIENPSPVKYANFDLASGEEAKEPTAH